MAIITIARQMGSLGSETAAYVAQRLDYTLVDQAKLQQAAEDYGMLKSELEEVHERRPTLVTRYLTMRHRAYLDMIQTIIYQYARADDVVILARGATVLLSDVPSALHVNVFAPFERRVEVVMAREGIARPIAEQIVRESDQDRAGYMRYLFDQDWMDPLLYDVMINTEVTTREHALSSSSRRRMPRATRHPRAIVGDPRQSYLGQTGGGGSPQSEASQPPPCLSFRDHAGCGQTDGDRHSEKENLRLSRWCARFLASPMSTTSCMSRLHRSITWTLSSGLH